MTEVVATNQTIVVVGGGISGMTAALEADETGKQVNLIEKRPYLGGRVSQRYKYFPNKKVQANENVHFIKSKVANIEEDGETGTPILHGVDTEGTNCYANQHDLVVLATGMEPSVAVSEFPVEIVVNEGGFIELDEKNGAIFAAGCSADAFDVNRSVQHATATALRAVQVVSQVARAEG